MEQELLTRYGNVPRHIRERLATAQKGQPNAEEESGENEVSGNEHIPADTTPPSDPAEQGNHAEHIEHDESNDVKAWKGRVNKEQLAHNETRSRLLAETEARQKAEAEVKAAQDQLAKLQEQLSKNATPPSPPPPSEDDEQLSDEDIAEMEMMLGGNAGKKLAKFLRQSSSNRQHAATAMNDEQVQQLVDQRFAQKQQDEQQQQKLKQWQQEMQTQVPEFQGLIADPAFNQFLHEKVIDFAGNNALQLVQYAGTNHDVRYIPKLKALADEFKQQQSPSSGQAKQATVPPNNRGAAVRPQNGKKKITPAIQRKIQHLRLTGKTDELRELFEKYEY